MVQYTKFHSSAMCLQVDWDVHYIIYQKLSGLQLQSWKRLDMLLLKMRVQHLNLRLLRRPLTSRNLNVDHILASLQRKLPPVPSPPPFPEGYAPPSTAEASENEQAETQLPPVDPVIDEGPSKRLKV